MVRLRSILINQLIAEPLLFLAHTSRMARTRESANSGVIHLPSSTPTITDKVSRTRERVSSDVCSRNGPISLAIRDIKGVKAASSVPLQKLSSRILI